MTDETNEERSLIQRLRDSVIVPPTSRRDFLIKYGGGFTATLAAGSLLPLRAHAEEAKLPDFGTIPDSWKGSGEVVVVTWGGIGTEMQRKAWFEPFERLCGIKVVEAIGPDPAKVKAMVDTKTTSWDVCQIGRGTMIELSKQGDYWEPIDYGLMEPGVTDNYRSEYGVDVVPFAQMIAYRTDIYPDGPKNWADFYDMEKYPGGRTLPIATKGNIPELAGALLAEGVALSDIYPIDIDRAIAKMATLKPKIVKWWESGAQPMQMLVDNEAPLATAWNGRVYAAKKEGKPLEIVWNGGTLLNNAWLVPKGAPNLSNAQKFIAFSLSAVAQARYSILLPYGYTNVDAVNYIPADILPNLPTSPENAKVMTQYDHAWWAANRPEIIEKFNKMILS